MYQHVKGVTDIREINKKIRKEIRHAKSRDKLTELLGRSRYLITLTFSPGWKKSYKGKLRDMRRAAKEEYTTTARTANKMVDKLELSGGYYDIEWGD